jgi:peptide chain release factor 3
VASRIGEEAWNELRDELELVQGASHPFDKRGLPRRQADAGVLRLGVNNFGVQLLLDFFVEHAPAPKSHATTTRIVECGRKTKLTGFVFKIQANMDPMHRDRVAFMRICSGKFDRPA